MLLRGSNLPDTDVTKGKRTIVSHSLPSALAEGPSRERVGDSPSSLLCLLVGHKGWLSPADGLIATSISVSYDLAH